MRSSVSRILIANYADIGMGWVDVEFDSRRWAHPNRWAIASAVTIACIILQLEAEG